jgi:hypothetical protein
MVLASSLLSRILSVYSVALDVGRLEGCMIVSDTPLLDVELVRSARQRVALLEAEAARLRKAADTLEGVRRPSGLGARIYFAGGVLTA